MLESPSTEDVLLPRPASAADELTPIELAAGVTLLRLLETRGRWIHRRVETIEVDDPWARTRRLSIDFTVPHDPPAPLLALGSPLYLIPIAVMRKQKLTQFSLMDESNRALSLLTHSQNAAIATATLIALADREVGQVVAPQFGEHLPPDLAQELWEITRNPDRDKSLDLWRAFSAQNERNESAKSREWRRLLTEHGDFMALAGDLARSFLMLVPLSARGGERRVVKYSYVQEVTPAMLDLPTWMRKLRDGWYSRLVSEEQQEHLSELDRGRQLMDMRTWVRMINGRWARRVTFDAPAMGHGGSYHCEVRAPAGLQITQAVLRRGSEDKKVDGVSQSVSHAHLYFSGQSEGEGGGVLVDLRPRMETLVRASVLTSALTTLLLLFVLIRSAALASNLGAAPGLLLVIPAGLAAWIARSQEPAATTEILFGFRVLAFLSAAWAFAAAALLIGGRRCSTSVFGASSCDSWPATPILLFVLTCCSAATFVVLMRAATFVARPPEQLPSRPDRAGGA